MDLPTRGNYKREKVPKYGAQQRLFTSRNAQKTGSDTQPFRQVPQHFQASPLQRWSHNSVIMIRLLILLLLLLLFNGTSSAATVIFPDCKDTIVGPLCSVGGTIINPASANPVSITGAIVPLSSGSAPTIGWRYISSPLTNNFAISLYSTSAGSSSLFPTQACKNLVYSDLTTPGQGTVWAVLSLHLPADGAVTSTQPIVGIFGNATAACPLLYTLPTGIVGGPIYAYTAFDEGSYPGILTRVQMSTASFPCSAPGDTKVSYILLGTMQVTTADFAVAAAGFTSPIPGCSSDFVYAVR